MGVEAASRVSRFSGLPDEPWKTVETAFRAPTQPRPAEAGC